MDHDLVRGGTLVDGTVAAARTRHCARGAERVPATRRWVAPRSDKLDAMRRVVILTARRARSGVGAHGPPLQGQGGVLGTDPRRERARQWDQAMLVKVLLTHAGGRAIERGHA